MDRLVHVMDRLAFVVRVAIWPSVMCVKCSGNAGSARLPLFANESQITAFWRSGFPGVMCGKGGCPPVGNAAYLTGGIPIAVGPQRYLTTEK